MSDYKYPIIDVRLMCLNDFYNRELSTKVIELINSYGKDFIPDKFDNYQPLKKKYNLENLDEVLEGWLNEEGNSVNKEYMMGSLLMKKSRSSKASYMISWEKTQEPNFHYFSLSVNIDYLKNQKKIQKFMELSKELIFAFNPVNGWIINKMSNHNSGPINLRLRHPELQWLNIFGKPYIELFGREKLLNTPCYKAYELSEDIIIIQLTESVFEDIPDEVRLRVKEYLGKDAFVELGKSSHNYKEGIAPNFDFTDVLFDKTKPVELEEFEIVEELNMDDFQITISD